MSPFCHIIQQGLSGGNTEGGECDLCAPLGEDMEKAPLNKTVNGLVFYPTYKLICLPVKV